MENLINTLFPPKCIFCGRVSEQVICNKCVQECKPLYSTNCIVCDKESLFGQTHINCQKYLYQTKEQYAPVTSLAVYEYAGYVRDCIRRSKYSTKEFSALKQLTNEGIKSITDKGYYFSNDLIVIPVPLNKNKEHTRGFNQAEIIAKKVAIKFNLKYAPNILKRATNTQAQHDQTRQNRFKNIKNAFLVKSPQKIKNKRILIVDDIWTTGATLLEAAKTLYTAGAKEVHTFTLSKKEKFYKKPQNLYNKQDDQLYLSNFANSPSKTVA